MSLHLYQKDALVKCIYKDIVNGYTTSQIAHRVKNDKYDLGFKPENERYAELLIMEARKIVADDFKNERETMKPKLVAVVHDILKEASENQDAKMRLEAVKEIAKLTGSYEPDKVEVKEEIVVNFGLDEENNEG